ncbi:peptidoglycan editing factor PgeF [Alphaproteobacteria bacterium LSUCC0684]
MNDQFPPYLTHPLVDLPGIRHGFFTRHGGVSTGVYESLNGGLGSKDDATHVAANRSRAANAIGGSDDTLMGLYQIHSSIALTACPGDDQRRDGDALVTSSKGLTLIILTADCVPIVFADAKNGVIGAAHAGWRGAVDGIVEETIKALLSLGAEAAQIRAAIGPAIQQPSYQVGTDLREEVMEATSWAEAFFEADSEASRFRFNLPGYVMGKLNRLGVESAAINEDTYSDHKFFSHRRATHQKLPDTGRLMTMIRLD